MPYARSQAKYLIKQQAALCIVTMTVDDGVPNLDTMSCKSIEIGLDSARCS